MYTWNRPFFSNSLSDIQPLKTSTAILKTDHPGRKVEDHFQIQYIWICDSLSPEENVQVSSWNDLVLNWSSSLIHSCGGERESL